MMPMMVPDRRALLLGSGAAALLPARRGRAYTTTKTANLSVLVPMPTTPAPVWCWRPGWRSKTWPSCTRS